MRICEKCGAEAGPNHKHCQECGAPLDDSPEAMESADRDVYPMLARANLLRMRGDLKQAENSCVEILRRYPNHPTANTLMGDILLDQEKYEEARQWFLAALDIDPNNSLAKSRLARLESLVSSDTERPPVRGAWTGSTIWLWALFLLVAVALGASGFVAGRRLAEQESNGGTQFLQRRLPPKNATEDVRGSSRMLEVIRIIAREDKGLSERIVSMVFDPRSFEATVTVRADPPYEHLSLGELAVRTAFAIFRADPECRLVRVCVLGTLEGRMETLLAADVRRSNAAVPEGSTETRLFPLLERAWWHPLLPTPPETPPPVPLDGTSNGD